MMVDPKKAKNCLIYFLYIFCVQNLEKLIIAYKLALSKNKKSIVLLSLITLVCLISSIKVWHFETPCTWGEWGT